MKSINFFIAITLLIIILFINKCDNRYLRGYVKPSKDGKTYFVIVDDNGGGCGKIFIDGKEWKYKINETGPISPGQHIIKCGVEIHFEIPEGVIFYFDYWGP